MTETLAQWGFDHLEELQSAISEIATMAKADGHHPQTVHTVPMMICLVRETLTDQSTVLNITIQVRG
jgi:hypothetical protein